jgi:hypothetical protein
VEEYVACRLFLLSVNFKLGELGDRETTVSKLLSPMVDFLIARLPKESVDRFCVKVELTAVGIVGRYTHGEHKVYIQALLNGGRVNRVFEYAGVPYEPCLEPDSEVSEDAAKKRK